MPRKLLLLVAGCIATWPLSTSRAEMDSGDMQLLERALHHARNGQAKYAREYFEKAISLDAPPHGTFRNYAVFLYQEQSHSEAAAVLQRGLAFDQDPMLLTMLLDLLKEKETQRVKVMWRGLRGEFALDACAFCKHQPQLAATTLIKAKKAAIVSKGITANTVRCCGVQIDEAGFGQEAERVLAKAHTVFPADMGILDSLRITQANYYGSMSPSSTEHSKAYMRLAATFREVSRPANLPASAVEWHSLIHELPPRSEEGCAAREGDPRFDIFYDCPTIAATDLTPSMFMSRFVEANKAVVITGTSTAASAWHRALERLRSSATGSVVEVAFAASSDGRLNKLVDLEDNLEAFMKVTQQTAEDLRRKYKDGKVLIRPTTTRMHTEDFFQFFDRQLPDGVYPYVHQTDAGQFANSTADILSLPRPPDFASILEKRLVWRNLWLSPRGVQTDPHFDQYDNLILVANGTKDVLLFPPTAYEDLGYKPSLHVFPGEGTTAELLHGGSDKSQQSSVSYQSYHLDAGQRPPLDYLNPQGPRAKAYQHWTQRHACRAVLDESRALFIPAFWTHAVHGTASPTFSINYWFERHLELEDAIALSRRS